jgi:hypothetical protein
MEHFYELLVTSTEYHERNKHLSYHKTIKEAMDCAEAHALIRHERWGDDWHMSLGTARWFRTFGYGHYAIQQHTFANPVKIKDQ